MKRDDIQFPAKHSALRDDVHVLGGLVGDVLKEQGGDALFDLVEKDRRLSIKRRAGDKEAAAELGVQLRGRAPQVARDLARAFSMWFRAVNLAEKVHRIRRRRNYFLAAQWAGRSGRKAMKLTDVTMTTRFVLSGDMTQLRLWGKRSGSTGGGGLSGRYSET